MLKHRPASVGMRDRGSASVEVVLVAPVMLLLLLCAVALGRLVNARLDVDSAAQQAARAASLLRLPGKAQQVADQTARTALAETGRACQGFDVTADTSHFTAGGSVTVTVACTTELSDLGIPLPGSHVSRSTASVPVDSYEYVADGRH
ncbi:TadE/TadG family type IV pilus assembly protein [Streptacidiphilus rugosus]|uniref:TadE/TadG family type IV pilus assembly protein n=1 Tax=Streptacidiphilus rugosus TaxID=405783 RepID=UPI000567B5C3|nr:TadE/TadG family type IV pilus assembly protein [Streptacidiphilus rugosus]